MQRQQKSKSLHFDAPGIWLCPADTSFWHLWFWFSSTSNILWPHCVSAALWGPQQQILFFLSGTILKKWREKWKISQSERVTSYRWLVTAKIISLNLVLFPVTWLWALKSSFLSFDHESVRLRRRRGGLLQVNNYQKDLFAHYISIKFERKFYMTVQAKQFK